ncbi:Phospholipase C [Quaeritorhiza haematococci]|nr:Phospholipase C [Quaeritorhiza haematococci]
MATVAGELAAANMEASKEVRSETTAIEAPAVIAGANNHEPSAASSVSPPTTKAVLKVTPPAVEEIIKSSSPPTNNDNIPLPLPERLRLGHHTNHVASPAVSSTVSPGGAAVSPNALLPSPALTTHRQAKVSPEDLQQYLTDGTRMVKYPNKSSSKPEERLIKVDLAHLQITWESRKKKSTASRVDFHSIREIRIGQNTKAFELHGKKPEVEERAFSIIYVSGGKYGTLNLVAPTKEDCFLWVSGLHMLIADVDDPSHPYTAVAVWLMRLHCLSSGFGSLTLFSYLVRGHTWLRTLWKEMDTKGSDRLDLDEVTALLKRLNIRLSKSEVKSAFKNQDISKHGTVSFDAFERFYRVLRFRPEIGELFSSLARTNPSVLTYEEFKDFLLNIQKNNWTEQQCRDYYDKYTPSPVLSSNEYLHLGGTLSSLPLMDIDHFSAFLISANNAIFRKAHTEVCQDMTMPLNCYYINTSHNTYLLGDQFAGESSVEGYIRALQKGCRCVELDCWDGPNGQPIIYHGRTLTGRILFRDAIEAIAKYAFVASSYPLILSLETHCCLEQQTTMAKVLREILGEMLVVRPIPEAAEKGTLPSPSDLMNKVLVKGKILAANMEEGIEYETEDEDGGAIGIAEGAQGAGYYSHSEATPAFPPPTPQPTKTGSFGTISTSSITSASTTASTTVSNATSATANLTASPQTSTTESEDTVVPRANRTGSTSSVTTLATISSASAGNLQAGGPVSPTNTIPRNAPLSIDTAPAASSSANVNMSGAASSPNGYGDGLGIVTNTGSPQTGPPGSILAPTAMVQAMASAKETTSTATSSHVSPITNNTSDAPASTPAVAGTVSMVSAGVVTTVGASQTAAFLSNQPLPPGGAPIPSAIIPIPSALAKKRASHEDLLTAPARRKTSSPKQMKKIVTARLLSEMIVYCKGRPLVSFAHARGMQE